MAESKRVYLVKEAIECTYDWKITNFTRGCINNRSPTFIASPDNVGHDWDLYLTITGNFWQVSIYKGDKCKVENGTPIQIVLSIVTEQQDEVNRRESIAVCLDSTKVVEAFNKFVDMDYLFDEKNGLVIDGKCTIRCRLYLFPNTFNATTMIESPSSLERRLLGFSDFERILDNGQLSDYELRFPDGEIIRVHISILAARSDYFLTTMQSGLVESKAKRTEIIDTRKDVMKELLRFIYSNRVENIETMAEDLMIAAEKYNVEGLKVLCGEEIAKSLSVDNVGDMLVLADVHRNTALRNKTLEFMFSHKNRIDTKALLLNADKVKLSIVDIIGLLKE